MFIENFINSKPIEKFIIAIKEPNKNDLYAIMEIIERRVEKGALEKRQERKTKEENEIRKERN